MHFKYALAINVNPIRVCICTFEVKLSTANLFGTWISMDALDTFIKKRFQHFKI